MIFTDASQPTFPDPWDFPTLSATPDETDLSSESNEERHAAIAPQSPQSTKQHAGWREMLADIQHGLQWGLNH